MATLDDDTGDVPLDAFLMVERERDEAREELAEYKATRVTVSEEVWAQLLIDGADVKLLPGIVLRMQGRYVMARVAGKPVLRLNEEKIMTALAVLMAALRVMRK